MVTGFDRLTQCIIICSLDISVLCNEMPTNVSPWKKECREIYCFVFFKYVDQTVSEGNVGKKL